MTDAITTSPLGHIETSARKLSRMPPKAACEALEDIAHRDGDPAVLDTLGRLSPVHLAAMMRQYDFSVPAFITPLLTPETAAAILKADPLFWRDVPDKEKTGHFIDIRESARDLVSTVVIHTRDTYSRADTIACICRDDESREYLLLPFTDPDIESDLTALFDDPETETGSLGHLFETIRQVAPGEAGLIADFTRQEPVDPVDLIRDIREQACQMFETDPRDAVVENRMFQPVQ